MMFHLLKDMRYIIDILVAQYRLKNKPVVVKKPKPKKTVFLKSPVLKEVGANALGNEISNEQDNVNHLDIQRNQVG